MSSNQPRPTEDENLWMFEQMVVSRAFEDAMARAYIEGKQPVFDFTAGPLPGEMHISSGQEPCAAGVCVHLRPTDFVAAPHRLHHIAIAKGLALDTMAAEIFGKKKGLSGGRGGHMHLIDPELGFWSTGIVGQGVGVAAGQALAFKIQGKDDVAIAYIGEGAANQGIFHESMNLAGLWKLPLIVVIEDNNWSVSVPKSLSTAIPRNSDRAAAYGAVGEYVEDNDVWGVYMAAKLAIDRAREGGGPTIIEVETHRLAGHFVGDVEHYVPQDERDARKDPITVFAERLVAIGQASEAQLEAIRGDALARVEAADRYAREAAYPEPDEAFEHIFV